MHSISVRAVHTYKSPRQGNLTPKQVEVRSIAYALKRDNYWNPRVAQEMAEKITIPYPILVPVPSLSSGTISANWNLCMAIANQLDKAIGMVLPMIQPIMKMGSQSARHREGNLPLKADNFPFRIHPIYGNYHIQPSSIILVDNVITSGHTMMACVHALGVRKATGLVWADAQATITRGWHDQTSR